jgi:hypothetical protein
VRVPIDSSEKVFETGFGWRVDGTTEINVKVVQFVSGAREVTMEWLFVPFGDVACGASEVFLGQIRVHFVEVLQGWVPGSLRLMSDLRST